MRASSTAGAWTVSWLAVTVAAETGPCVPNQTYTGTVVGNCPVIVIEVPPHIDELRGFIDTAE